MLGADSVIVVGRVSLTIFGAGGGVVTHLNGLEVAGVGRVEGGLVLSTDSLEDSVGGGNGFVLLFLVLGSREGSRVEQDEGVLFGSDGGEVTGGNSTLQVNDSATVGVSCSLDGSYADGSIGEGSHRHGGNTGGGNNSSHGRTAVHVQGSGGTLSGEKERGNKSISCCQIETSNVRNAMNSCVPLGHDSLGLCRMTKILEREPYIYYPLESAIARKLKEACVVTTYLTGGGRGKGRSRSDKGGGDDSNEFHLVLFLVIILWHGDEFCNRSTREVSERNGG